MKEGSPLDLTGYGFPREVPVPARAGTVPLERAVQVIRDVVTDVRLATPAQAQRRDHLVRLAQAGDAEAARALTDLIAGICDLYGIAVPDMDAGQVAGAAYATLYGLDVLERLYHDPSIDEIQVNGPADVYIQRHGINQKADVRFVDDDHVSAIITRLLLHDGQAVNRGQMVVESTRRDGARVTAAIPPVAARPSVVLRKMDSFVATPENYLKAGTLNSQLLALLATLVRGRANILISGPTASGKTKLLGMLAGYLDPKLRLVSMETDRELWLSRLYPDRNIDELEEHAEAGLTLKALFKVALRRSPDVIIMGEARGAEAEELLKAATRGHDGTLGTVHQSSPEEAVTGVALMVLDDGKNLPLDLLRLQVARAFNVVIQLHGDRVRGIKRVDKVTELLVERDQVQFRDLCVWKPSARDYAVGDWEFPRPISDRLAAKLHKYRGEVAG